MLTKTIRALIGAGIAPVLFVASLPFATASCAIFETLRPSITAAGHILLNGLDELLAELESGSGRTAERQELTSDIIVKLEICAETVPDRYLEPYRRRFRAALVISPVPEGLRTTDPD